jgi:hypothetical protein
VSQFNADEAHRHDDQRRDHHEDPTREAWSVSPEMLLAVCVVWMWRVGTGVIAHWISSVIGATEKPAVSVQSPFIRYLSRSSEYFHENDKTRRPRPRANVFRREILVGLKFGRICRS